MTQEILDKPHRHLVFTIPEHLRTKIYWNRELLKVLSDTSARVVTENTQDLTAGIITVIHTFGRDLGFNPHVHVLVTEGGFKESLRDNNAKWLGIYFLPYSKLRKQWQYYLLTELRKHLPKEKKVSKLIDKLFVDYPKGFYVNAESRIDDAQKAAKYVGRYVARPAIAESRIHGYDGKAVTFSYEDHETGETKLEILPVLQFIGRLIMHIPQKGYQMVKRYGLYARHIKPVFRKAMELMRKAKQLIFNFFSGRDTWRQRIISRFQKDPLLCPICGFEMELWFVWHPECGVLYDIIMDGPFLCDAMAKARIDNEEKQEKEEQSNSPPEEIQLYLPMYPVLV
jgi:plasmid rolling circle replication initiator protein Rep